MRELAAEARKIDDPYHAAWALFQMSRDEPRLRDEALELLDAVAQDWRRAELAADVTSAVQDDPQTVLALARRVVLLPAGKARSQALKQIVKRVATKDLSELLAAVIQDPETGVDDGKTILRAWTMEPAGDMEAVLRLGEGETTARLWGYLHLQSEKAGKPLVENAFTNALQTAQKVDDRVSLLRYLATVAQTPEELDALLELEGDTESRVRLLLKTIAQADRLRHKEHAESYLGQAQTLIQNIPDPQIRAKLETNLEKAAARLHGSATESGVAEKRPEPPKTRAPQKRPASTAPELPEGARPVLALHNGYTGGLAPPHLRAVGRAAPLCAAFGLDLMLIGFPADDAAALIQQVEKDSRIGEEVEYVRMLQDAKRILWVPREDHVDPGRWPVDGPVVATTPHPDPGKATSLDVLHEAPVLVMGLGPQGLPQRLLNQAAHHLELTGHNVSLETATAMGVLAQQLHEQRKKR